MVDGPRFGIVPAQARSARVHFSSCVEAKTPQFKVEPAPRQAKRARRFGDVAGRSIERRLNHVAFDLLDR